jgi:demethylmenaquinone methyltransferase/2-methoxy-6-polyprenyl-1,4-benzoquinol methylase
MKETEKIKKIYDRNSKFYDSLESFFEKNTASKWRKKFLSSLKGNILEVGVGTGKNLEYYSKDAKVTGIDFSQGMLNKAIKKSNKLSKNITLLKMDAQDLKFPDNTFDYVVTTFVLCSIPYPVKALKEIRRVLKGNGRYIAIEHMLSKNFFIALHEHILNPITKNLFGFNVNRKTVENIKKAGLNIIELENLAFFDELRLIIAVK